MPREGVSPWVWRKCQRCQKRCGRYGYELRGWNSVGGGSGFG